MTKDTVLTLPARRRFSLPIETLVTVFPIGRRNGLSGSSLRPPRPKPAHLALNGQAGNENHAPIGLNPPPDEQLLVANPIFQLHQGGKISVQGKMALVSRETLSMAYTPGVAQVSSAIARDRTQVWGLTGKSNSVAIVSDGTAVLGLGDIGPEAAMPVMEGKAMLFKHLAASMPIRSVCGPRNRTKLSKRSAI